LRDAIGNLPILECCQKSNIKWHDASMFKWSASQIAVMAHTPSGMSAHDNPLPWKPVNADGSPSGAKFRCSFQRRNWDDACNTILQDSKSISGFRTCHPGNFTGYDASGLPVYNSARPLTILEILRITGLPDDSPIPNWASDNLIRQMLGECWAPKHALECLRLVI
jgi:DNA (cytosine-5)-methyltransferase 1